MRSLSLSNVVRTSLFNKFKKKLNKIAKLFIKRCLSIFYIYKDVGAGGNKLTED